MRDWLRMGVESPPGREVLMKRWIVLASAAVLCGCNGSTSPTPDFVGNYSFVLEASSICGSLPVTRYEWNVVSTTAGSPGPNSGASYRMTLPGGDNPTLNLTLSYQQTGGGRRGRGGNTNLDYDMSDTDI